MNSNISPRNSFWAPDGTYYPIAPPNKVLMGPNYYNQYITLPKENCYKESPKLCLETYNCEGSYIGYGNANCQTKFLDQEVAYWQNSLTKQFTQESSKPDLNPKCHTDSDKLLNFKVPRENNPRYW